MGSCKSYVTEEGNELQSSLRDLGITVSNDFSWSEHIAKITTKGNQMAAWALSLYKNRGRAHMLTLYKSYVRSHLEFSCPLWNPYRITDIAALEGVQRTFTSRIHGFQHLNYCER